MSLVILTSYFQHKPAKSNSKTDFRLRGLFYGLHRGARRGAEGVRAPPLNQDFDYN